MMYTEKMNHVTTVGGNALRKCRLNMNNLFFCVAVDVYESLSRFVNWRLLCNSVYIVSDLRLVLQCDKEWREPWTTQ